MRYRKKPKPVSNITLVYDDREKNPWMFLSKRWPMVKKRLKVGDYTIKGFENKIAIEKKSGIAELFSDLTTGERSGFERFLQRLSQYPVKAIVVEDSFFGPLIYSIAAILKRKSRGKSRLTAHTIFHWTSKISIEYGIPILFVDKSSCKEIVTKLVEQCISKAEKL